ncbi:hypothetical protein [Geodermatophilus sp. URMC 64]
MSTRSARLATLLAAAVLLAGCTGDGSSSEPTSGSAAETSPEPAPAEAEASAEAAADPADATDAPSAALSIALRAEDLPDGWTVQANPVPDGDLAGNPSLAGICGGTFPSEAARTAKFPVTGVDPDGTPAVVSEAISYRTAGDAAGALGELRAAFAACPAGDRTIVDPPPRVDGLAADTVVVEYELASGARQQVVAQARGAVVSVLLGEDPTATAGAARSIAGRLAALPPAAIGL